MYVLTDLIPEEPAPNAHSVVRDTYQKWLIDHTTVHCIMQVATNDKFSHKFEKAQSEGMLKVLNESFETFDDVE